MMVEIRNTLNSTNLGNSNAVVEGMKIDEKRVDHEKKETKTAQNVLFRKKKKKKVVIHIGRSKKIKKNRKRKKKKKKRRKVINWDIMNQPFYTSKLCGMEGYIREHLKLMDNIGKSNDVRRSKRYNQIREELYSEITKKKIFPNVFMDEFVSPLKEVNIELYSNTNLKKRENLFHSRRIKFWIFKLFDALVFKNANGEIPQFVYIELLKVFYELLLKKYHPKYRLKKQIIDFEYFSNQSTDSIENVEKIEEGPKNSSVVTSFFSILEGIKDKNDEIYENGAMFVNWEEFYKGIFEICDVWTNSCEEGDYAIFLKKFFKYLCSEMRTRKMKLKKMRKIYGPNSYQVFQKFEKTIICDEFCYKNILKFLDSEVLKYKKQRRISSSTVRNRKSTRSDLFQKRNEFQLFRKSNINIRTLNSSRRRRRHSVGFVGTVGNFETNKKLGNKKLSTSTVKRSDFEVFSRKEEQKYISSLRRKILLRKQQKERKERSKLYLERKRERLRSLIKKKKKKRMKEKQRVMDEHHLNQMRKYKKVKSTSSQEVQNNSSDPVIRPERKYIIDKKEMKMKIVTFDVPIKK